MQKLYYQPNKIPYVIYFSSCEAWIFVGTHWKPRLN